MKAVNILIVAVGIVGTITLSVVLAPDYTNCRIGPEQRPCTVEERREVVNDQSHLLVAAIPLFTAMVVIVVRGLRQYSASTRAARAPFTQHSLDQMIPPEVRTTNPNISAADITRPVPVAAVALMLGMGLALPVIALVGQEVFDADAGSGTLGGTITMLVLVGAVLSVTLVRRARRSAVDYFDLLGLTSDLAPVPVDGFSPHRVDNRHHGIRYGRQVSITQDRRGWSISVAAPTEPFELTATPQGWVGGESTLAASVAHSAGFPTGPATLRGDPGWVTLSRPVDASQAGAGGQGLLLGDLALAEAVAGAYARQAAGFGGPGR